MEVLAARFRFRLSYLRFPWGRANGVKSLSGTYEKGVPLEKLMELLCSTNTLLGYELEQKY